MSLAFSKDVPSRAETLIHDSSQYVFWLAVAGASC